MGVGTRVREREATVAASVVGTLGTPVLAPTCFFLLGGVAMTKPGREEHLSVFGILQSFPFLYHYFWFTCNGCTTFL